MSFPYGTLIVNLTGCFVLGVGRPAGVVGTWSPELRAAIAVGFLGGFTTYSSFNQETLDAVRERRGRRRRRLNVAMTLAGGLAAGSLRPCSLARLGSVVRLFDRDELGLARPAGDPALLAAYRRFLRSEVLQLDRLGRVSAD